MEPNVQISSAPSQGVNRFNKIYIGLLFTSALVLGFVGNFVVDPYLPLQISNTKKAHAQGFVEAKELVQKSPLGKLFPQVEDMRFVSGKVTAINGNKITIHITNNDPFDDSFIADRVVVVASTTKIIKQVAKDRAVFQDELKNSFTKTSGMPAVPNIEIPGTILDIKIGDSISVSVSSNIKKLPTFNADSVTIMLSNML